MCMGILPTCKPVHDLHAVQSSGGEKRASDPLELNSDSCELPSECWELVSAVNRWAPKLSTLEMMQALISIIILMGQIEQKAENPLSQLIEPTNVELRE